MKSVKVVISCTLALLVLAFVAACACASRDDDDGLQRFLGSEQLQEEIEMLRQELMHLKHEHSNLQAELKNVLEQVEANGLASNAVNGEYQVEFPMFHHDLQSLLNETGYSDFSFEHAGWQNLATSSIGREYILWRGSWNYLDETESYINLLTQHGWELVTMFGAGMINGIVVVMRR